MHNMRLLFLQKKISEWATAHLTKTFFSYSHVLKNVFIIEPFWDYKLWYSTGYSAFARSPLSLPQTPFFARAGPPFVIRSVLIGWGLSGLQMVDLSERENGIWKRERGDRANIEFLLQSR